MLKNVVSGQSTSAALNLLSGVSHPSSRITAKSAFSNIFGSPKGNKLNVGGIAAGMVMGGVSSWMAGADTPGGFIGGALAGGLGGAAASRFAGGGLLQRQGRKMMTHSRTMDRGNLRNVVRNRGVNIYAAGKMMNRNSDRNIAFGTGAFLGGGAFGLMFGGEGRSHKRGFNRRRGNSFAR